MLVHQMDVFESCEAPLIDTEIYLRETCKEYYIDYNTCECKARPVTEGLVSGFVNLIKTIFQKAIAFLVKIWKAIVDFVKSIFKKAVEFFKRLLGIKTNKKVAVKVGLIMDPTKPPKIVKTNSPQESQNLFKKAFQNINQLIQKTSRENISLTQRYESMTVSKIREGYIPQIVDNTYIATEGEFHNKETHSDDTDTSKHYEKKKDEQVTALLKGVFENPDISPEIKDRLKKMYTAVSYQGGTLAEHMSVSNIEFIDMKKAKELVVAENLTEMMEDLVEISYSNYVKKYMDLSKDEQFAKEGGYQTTLHEFQNFGKNMKELMDAGVSQDDLGKYLMGQYFPQRGDDENDQQYESKVRRWLKLRINWNDNIIKTLQNMIMTNQKLLGLTTEQALAITKDLQGGSLDSTKLTLEENKDKIISKDHTFIDGKKLGLGTICISDAIAEDSLKNNDQPATQQEVEARVGHRGWYYEVANFWLSDTPITYLTKYDVTIVGHGDTLLDEQYKTDSDGKIIKDKDGDPIIVGGGWIVEKVRTPKGHYCETVFSNAGIDYIRMHDLVKQLVKEGYKRINIVSCNPGKHHLPPSVQNNKRVMVRMSLSSTLIA